MFGTYAGTLTTTAPNKKDSLTWAYVGQNDNGVTSTASAHSVAHGTLTITGGTGKFANAHGRATFTAASSPSFTATIFPGPPSPFSLTGTAFYVIQGTILSPEDQR